MNIYYVAAIWLGMALLASVVSIKIAVPAALVEIVVGALAGNIPGIQQHVASTDVVTFLASVGSLVLTFLAGAEIDPVSLRGHWKASLSIGAVSFALPFLAAFGFCKLVLGWQLVMVNAYRHPGCETILTWWVFIAAGLLDLPALQEHSLWVLYAYPVFFIVMGTGVLIATATGARSAARRSTAVAAAQRRPAEAGLPRTIGRAAAPRPSTECAAQLAAVLQAAEIPAGVRLAEATALLRAATGSAGPGRTVAP